VFGLEKWKEQSMTRTMLNCFWKDDSKIMDGMFIGADMLRSRDFKNWHVHDAAVTKEYADLGGDAN